MPPTRIQPQRFNWNRIFDYGTRAVTFSCIGIAIWGIGAGVMIHRDTMKRSQELLSDEEWVTQKKIENARKKAEKVKEEELTLARRAQAIIPGRQPPAVTSS